MLKDVELQKIVEKQLKDLKRELENGEISIDEYAQKLESIITELID